MPPGSKDKNGKERTNGTVITVSKNSIAIAVKDTLNPMTAMILDRKTARLLARRINQLLEATK